MNCPKCGFPVSNTATFCPKCGSSMINIPPVNRGYNSGYNQNHNSNNNNNILMLIIGIAAALIICVAAAIITFTIWENGNSEPSPSPSPSPSPTPTVEPTAMPTPTVQVVYVTQQPVNPPPHNQNPSAVNPGESYKTYYSSQYGFSCNYPASFVLYNDNGTLTLLTARSADGLATEKIVAKRNEGETVSSELNAFSRLHGGYVDYKSTGSDYFAVRLKNGSSEYYKYCKFANGNLYWFEFAYPADQNAIYDNYINDIYSTLVIK